MTDEVLVVSTLEAWAAAWDDLVLAAPRPSPFLRSWWLEAVAPGATRYALLVDGDRLLGGVAVAERRIAGIPRERLAGCVALAPHDLDVVAAPADAGRVAARIAEWLDRPGNRFVDLTGIAGDGVLRAALPAKRLETADIASSARLGTFDEYLAAIPKKLRQDIKRSRRRLDEKDVTYRAVTDDTERALRDLERLHNLRWRGATTFARDFERFAAAARLGAARGEVVFHEAVAGERVLASLVSFDLAGRCVLCQTGRDPDPTYRGTGTLVRAGVIERSCNLGSRELDMGPGHRDRKARWAPDARPVMRAIWGRGAGRALVRGYRTARPLVRRLRRAGAPGSDEEQD